VAAAFLILCGALGLLDRFGAEPGAPPVGVVTECGNTLAEDLIGTTVFSMLSWFIVEFSPN